MIALVAALLLAAPAVPAKPDAEWLTGLWVEQKKPGSQSLDECASWAALFYRADGTFAHGEREGSWELSGSRLIEQPSSAHSNDDPSLSPAGSTTVYAVARLGRDRMRRTSPDGKVATLLRCPKPETPVVL